MPIPFLNSISLNKNQVQDFCVYNIANDPNPALTSNGDLGYLWLNTTNTGGTIPTLKWWDGTNVRSIVDSTNISSFTAGLATDLAGGGAGQVVYQNGANDTAFLAAGTAGQVLSSNAASAPSWLNQSSLSVGSATNVAGGANGSILVQSGVGTTGALAIGANGYILTSNGTTPGWSATIPSSSVSGLAASATTDTTDASNITSGTLGLGRLSLATGQFYVGDGSNNPAATAKSSIPLSGFGAAGADVAMGGFKITGLADPAAATDAATMGYVDSVAQGLDVKASCLVATTADITLSSPGAVTIDGVYSATDFTSGVTRILVKDQSAPAENGIYIWQGPSAAMTRSADANTWDELVGAFTFVERGTANADSGWVCTVNAGGTLDTTAVTFTKFSQAGSYTAGKGIVQDGTAFNFAQSTNYTANTIPYASGTTTIGFISAGTADQVLRVPGAGGTPAFGAIDLTKSAAVTGSLPVANGGTGAATFTAGQIIFGNGTSALASSSNLFWDSANNRLGIGTAIPNRTLELKVATGPALRINNANGNSGIEILTASDRTSFLVGAQYNIDNGFEITPSTAAGGTTFSNPAIVVKSTGNVAIGNVASPSNLLTVNGAASIGSGYATTAAPTNGLIVQGNVGIGTATPQLTFVVSNAGAQGFEINPNGTGTYPGGIDILSFNRSTSAYKSWNSFAELFAWFTATTGSPVERMRLTSAGNLAIGNVASPSNLLTVNGAASIGSGYATTAAPTNGLIVQGNVGIGTTNPVIVAGTVVGISRDQNSETLLTISNQANNASNSAGIDIESFGGGWKIAVPHSSTYTNPLLFSMSGNERMRITSDGNVGIGVTPSAWASTYRAIQFALGGLAGVTNDTKLHLSNNAYFDATDSRWERIGSSPASRYELSDNTHKWHIAGTGSANTEIAWTQAMTLDASGNLALGTPTASGRLHVEGTNIVLKNGTGVPYFQIGGRSSDGRAELNFLNNALSANNAKLVAYTDTLAFEVAGTERLRIKSTGQVNFVGLASDPAGAYGDVYYNSTSNRLKYHNGTAWVDSGTRKYSGALTGTGTSFTVTHSLGTRDVTVQVRKSGSTYDLVYTDVQMATTDTVTIVFASSVTGSDYTVTVIG